MSKRPNSRKLTTVTPSVEQPVRVLSTLTAEYSDVRTSTDPSGGERYVDIAPEWTTVANYQHSQRVQQGGYVTERHDYMNVQQDYVNGRQDYVNARQHYVNAPKNVRSLSSARAVQSQIRDSFDYETPQNFYEELI